MATMIGIITTDANISRKLADKALKQVVGHTFNRVSVDGDTSVCDMLKGTAEKKSINISVEVDSKVEIYANKNRIKQMLINLIDNAIKYNFENGKIEITGQKETGKIVIIVRDTGIGIAPQHLDRIYERFYRVDKGRSRNMGGTGLGLSIVKHIVNLYNGDIRVNSKPGKGTEFVIQLPA